MTTAVLNLPPEERLRIERWARDGHPHEACGCLLGLREGSDVRVQRATAARNLYTARAHHRYELDPRDHLEAQEQARELGLKVVAIWHSHPDRPAEPSEVDRAGAWEGWSYVIVSVDAEGTCELRSWRLKDSRFEEEELRS